MKSGAQEKEILSPARQYIKDLLLLDKGLTIDDKGQKRTITNEDYKLVAPAIFTIIKPEEILDQISKTYAELQSPEEKIAFLNNASKLLVELKAADSQNINFPDFSKKEDPQNEKPEFTVLRKQYQGFIEKLKENQNTLPKNLQNAIKDFENNVSQISSVITKVSEEEKESIQDLQKASSDPIDFKKAIEIDLKDPKISSKRIDELAKAAADGLYRGGAIQFLSVTPGELQRAATGKAVKSDTNIESYTASFNKTTNRVVTDLLNPNISPEHQRNIARLYVKMAEYALKNGDYKTALAIGAALGKPSINRVKNISELKEVQNLVAMTDPLLKESSFKSLRARIENDEKEGKAYIPFLGSFTKDMTFINDGNPKEIERRSQSDDKARMEINTDRLIFLSKSLQQVQDGQMNILRSKIPGESATDVLDYVNNTQLLREDDEYAMSYQFMPMPIRIDDETTLPELIERFETVKTPPAYLKTKLEGDEFEVQGKAYARVLTVINRGIEKASPKEKEEAYRILKLIEGSAEKNGLLKGALVKNIENIKGKIGPEIIAAFDTKVKDNKNAAQPAVIAEVKSEVAPPPPQETAVSPKVQAAEEAIATLNSLTDISLLKALENDHYEDDLIAAKVNLDLAMEELNADPSSDILKRAVEANKRFEEQIKPFEAKKVSKEKDKGEAGAAATPSASPTASPRETTPSTTSPPEPSSRATAASTNPPPLPPKPTTPRMEEVALGGVADLTQASPRSPKGSPRSEQSSPRSPRSPRESSLGKMWTNVKAILSPRASRQDPPSRRESLSLEKMPEHFPEEKSPVDYPPQVDLPSNVELKGARVKEVAKQTERPTDMMQELKEAGAIAELQAIGEARKAQEKESNNKEQDSLVIGVLKEAFGTSPSRPLVNTKDPNYITIVAKGPTQAKVLMAALQEAGFEVKINNKVGVKILREYDANFQSKLVGVLKPIAATLMAKTEQKAIADLKSATVNPAPLNSRLAEAAKQLTEAKATGPTDTLVNQEGEGQPLPEKGNSPLLQSSQGKLASAASSSPTGSPEASPRKEPAFMAMFKAKDAEQKTVPSPERKTGLPKKGV